MYYFTPGVTLHNFNSLYKRFSRIEIFQAFIYQFESYFIKSLFKVGYEYQAWFPRFFIVFYYLQVWFAYQTVIYSPTSPKDSGVGGPERQIRRKYKVEWLITEHTWL
jgi:hypothetical protein